MTVEEMRKKLRDNCDVENIFDCGVCPLRTIGGECFPEDEEKLKENYELVFGAVTEDNVNHPKHYQGKHECIDEMIAMFGVEAVKHFCMCNVYKYRYRAAAKNGQEDLDKADWYMDKLIELGGI